MTGRPAPSRRVHDEGLIEKFVADEDNTFLVSFPRTGSHWLRMLMELYFERPTLVRTFYYPHKTDFLLLHTHDLDLKLQRSHVIYLYRDPVDTIYSQLKYEGESIDSADRVRHWATSYANHLNKWLCEESFTERKTIVRYEEMAKDLAGAFSQVVDHFNGTLDEERLKDISEQITKEEVRRKTTHDQQVVQLSQAYRQERERFKERHGQLVWQAVLEKRSHLRPYFT